MTRPWSRPANRTCSRFSVPVKVYSGMKQRPIWPWLATYGAVLLWLARRLPFWLDEVRQLIGTTQRSLAEVIHFVPENPGGVPLGYLVQFAFVHVIGPSRLGARLPSAIFSVLGCWVLAGLAREAGVSRFATLLVFAILPIQLRYAVEARPYSQALFFSMLSTWLLLRLRRSQEWRTVAWYGASIAA